MNITITYKQALERCSPRLAEKLKHSVELLRKAEKIALRYQPEHGFALGFSGGKDSQAAFHVAQLAGVKFHPFFSPTTVDHPDVIRFIKRNYPEVEILHPKKSIYQAAIECGCLPTMRIRWCCAAFKEGAYLDHVTITGVRKAESSRRSKRNEVEVTSHKFSGDIEGFDKWQQKRVEKIIKKMKNINQDQFAEVADESQVRCVGGKDKIMIMPIIEWTDADVWEFLNDIVSVPHCNLYDEGRSRIGCIMCPMSSYKNILADIRRYPHVYRKWIEVVAAIRDGRPTMGGGIWRLADRITPPPTAANVDQWETELRKGGYARGKRSRNGQPNTRGWSAPTDECKTIFKRSASDKDRAYLCKMGGGIHSGFLDSPLGGGLKITTPEEMIIHWWISKKSFKDWYSENFIQQKLDFEEDD